MPQHIPPPMPRPRKLRAVAEWHWHAFSWHDLAAGFSVGAKVVSDWHGPFAPNVRLWLMLGPGWLVVTLYRGAR